MLKCRHCYNQDTRVNRFADFFNESFVEQLLANGVQQLVLSGGEPILAWENLLNILKAIRGRLSIVITSNGVLLTHEKIKILKNNGVNTLQISLDGVSASSHEFLRGKGTYQHAFNLVKCYPDFITPMYTIHARNYNEVSPFILQQRTIGVKKIGFERYIPVVSNKRTSMLKLTKEQLFSAYEAILQYNDVEFHINDPLFNVFVIRKNKVTTPTLDSFPELGCEALSNNIYIDAGGDVYPCVFSKEMLFNIHYEPLMNHRTSPESQNYECINCDFFKFCKGCRAAAYFEFGDWKKRDPLCPLH